MGRDFRKEKLIFTGNPSGTGSGNGLEAWYLNSTTGNKYVSIANGNILTESEYDSSGVIIYEFHIDKGRTYNNVTYYPMLRYADITDNTYEPYQPSLLDRCMLKDNTGTILYNGVAAASSASITIENLSKYSLICIYIAGASTRSYRVSCSLPISYLSKGNTLNIGGIPSSNSSGGDECVKSIDGYITASMTTDSPDVLNLKIDNGIIGSIKIISVM